MLHTSEKQKRIREHIRHRKLGGAEALSGSRHSVELHVSALQLRASRAALATGIYIPTKKYVTILDRNVTT